MIWAIARKELLQYIRDGRIIVFVVLLIALAIAAALYSQNTVDTMERERVAARSVDRNVWDTQGKKSPHSAAHFSRYVFGPTSSLAIFDPGLTAYVGRAVWLEAHYRDPAKLRPVDDAVEIQRFTTFSPAWILQCFAPMLIILFAFSSIAGEREQGTLRYVISMGARVSALFWGKLCAVFLALLALVPVTVGAVFLAPRMVSPLPDTSSRLLLLMATYTVYLVAFAFAAIGVSARTKQSKTALVILLSGWAVSTVIIPRFAADFAEALYPSPDGTAFWAQLKKESSTAFWSKDAKGKRDKIRGDLLQKYNVKTVKELPINYDGYLLQESEEFANDVFDRRYGELSELFQKQHFVSVVFSVLSPTIAATNISRALAGTDQYAHQHFTNAAEQFRRRFIKSLNQEMIDHAGSAGYGYLVGDSFWQRTPDFDYVPPRIYEVWRQIWLDAIILFVWGFVAFILAQQGVKSAFTEEALK